MRRYLCLQSDACPTEKKELLLIQQEEYDVIIARGITYAQVFTGRPCFDGYFAIDCSHCEKLNCIPAAWHTRSVIRICARIAGRHVM